MSPFARFLRRLVRHPPLEADAPNGEAPIDRGPTRDPDDRACTSEAREGRLGPLDSARLSITSSARGETLTLFGSGTPFAIVHPPPGVMLLEALAVRTRDGREWAVAAAYDIEGRQGSLLRWERLADPSRAERHAEVVLEGGPDSVLWRLSVENEILHAHDGRRDRAYALPLFESMSRKEACREGVVGG